MPQAWDNQAPPHRREPLLRAGKWDPSARGAGKAVLEGAAKAADESTGKEFTAILVPV